MTTRNDVVVTFTTSPRVAEVADPSTEIIMQDLVDTLRKQEDTFEGMVFKKLINASGKEDLGGGVKVGITVAMQNLLLAFQGRTTPAETGTVTATPAAPRPSVQVFQDSTATFITNGVQRGSFVVNFTDQSIADVVSVDSETQLTTKVLVEGIGNTYDIADVYKVWNIIQVNATGGNLTAVDEFQAAISAILPTAFTQVILTSSSSATLSEQADIEYSSFNEGVTIDIDNITGNAISGTTFPAGTRRAPCLDYTDALAIINERGFENIYVLGNATIPTGLDFSNLHWHGQSAQRSVITIPAAAQVDDCEYTDAFVTGTLDGSSIIERCVIGSLEFVSGFIYLCGIQGTITLGGAVQANMLDCFSLIAGGGSTPIIDVGSGQSLVVRNWSGGLEIQNKTGSDGASIDVNSGQIIINDNCTGGAITLRGIGKWTNEDTYAGTTVITNELLTYADVQRTRNLMEADQVFDKTAGLLHYYFKGTTTDIIPPKNVAGEQVATDVTLVE